MGTPKTVHLTLPCTLNPEPFLLICPAKLSRLKVGSSHLSYSLNSLKGGIKGLYRGVLQGISKGHTRSLDYSSFRVLGFGFGV